jgi:hypothetical protein
MSGRVVSDIQTRAEGERLYVWYNTDAHALYSLCLVKRLDENISILQQFKINEWYLVRKLNLKFM